MAEWQTHQTQNLTGATSCRFESGCRHPWQGQSPESLVVQRFQGFSFKQESVNHKAKLIFYFTQQTKEETQMMKLNHICSHKGIALGFLALLSALLITG